MAIMLKDVLTVVDPTQYKLHLACRNQDWVSPLDEYVSGRDNWLGWNEWRGGRNRLNRPYIFAVMDFYPQQDRWLFGGVFKVLEWGAERYTVETVPECDKYEGRLLLRFDNAGMRGRAFYLENYIDHFQVDALFPSPYAGESFCGYSNINHGFDVLEPIFQNERYDWKAALSSVKGVYLIVDRSNGRKYVGSAYGEGGVWARWACYIGTGHGWNDGLTKLVTANGKEYARQNFMFSLLEIAADTTPNDHLIEREAYWKRVLMAREFGYNKN